MEKSEKFRRTFEKFEKALNKFREIIESQHLKEVLSTIEGYSILI